VAPYPVATAITYRVRRSKLAKRKRIIVTPDEACVDYRNGFEHMRRWLERHGGWQL